MSRYIKDCGVVYAQSYFDAYLSHVAGTYADRAPIGADGTLTPLHLLIPSDGDMYIDPPLCGVKPISAVSPAIVGYAGPATRSLGRHTIYSDRANGRTYVIEAVSAIRTMISSLKSLACSKEVIDYEIGQFLDTVLDLTPSRHVHFHVGPSVTSIIKAITGN